MMAFYRGAAITFSVLFLSGCVTHSFSKPANPNYLWLAGKWTNGESSWNQNLQLNVGDGNKIVGEYDLSNPESGRTHFGSVTGEINGEKINLTVSMQTFYATYKIHFTKINDTLYGTRTNDQTGESWALTVFKK